MLRSPQSTGFVLDPTGYVVVRVYSCGAIGQLVPEGVTRQRRPRATTLTDQRGKTPRSGATNIGEVPNKGDRGDGPGCGNGRDDAGGAARAGTGDKRRRRSG